MMAAWLPNTLLCFLLAASHSSHTARTSAANASRPRGTGWVPSCAGTAVRVQRHGTATHHGQSPLLPCASYSALT